MCPDRMSGLSQESCTVPVSAPPVNKRESDSAQGETRKTQSHHTYRRKPLRQNTDHHAPPGISSSNAEAPLCVLLGNNSSPSLLSNSLALRIDSESSLNADRARSPIAAATLHSADSVSPDGDPKNSSNFGSERGELQDTLRL